MRRVMVTHLESTLGQRLAKALYHDPEVALVVGVGTGPPPSFLDPYRDKCLYERLDLAKLRHLNSFVHSERFLRARFDSVVHLPFTAELPAERVPGNVPSLVSETRRLIEECRKASAIERFIYVSTGFVYQPEPGGGNYVTESQPLGFDVNQSDEIRAWIDADLICQGELKGADLMMTILRVSTIVSDRGAFLLSPPLSGSAGSLGFNPMLSVVADRDVARAIQLALHGDHPGIYNIAGREVFPRSELCVSTPRLGPIRLPRTLVSAVSLLGSLRGADSSLDRYGIVLDTRRARERLGFEPIYRIELRGQGSERRAEPVRCR